MEKLAERPPLLVGKIKNSIISDLERISGEWKLPFGKESGLLSSAAGEVGDEVSVVCGCSPASKDIYTPNEAVHRGELLQRTLLLTLFLAKL